MRRGMLYAATERAVWISFDDGDHWQSLQLNLPHTSMRDLIVHNQDLILATHGRSFWVLDDIGPLRAEVEAKTVTLLKPSPAIRVRRSTGTDTPIPPDEASGRNPPNGAVIDYYLPQASRGALSIAIFDSSGTLVRRVSSADAVGFSAEEREKELIPQYWIRQPKALAASAGMHRFVWDLHGMTPRAARRSFPISAVPQDTPQEPQGPLAAPGIYRVRLETDGHHVEQAVMVLPDPRVTAQQQDYNAQFALAKSLAEALDASSAKSQEIKALRAQIKKLNTPQAAAVAAQAKELDEHFDSLMEHGIDAGGQRGLERVNGEILSLYTQVGNADAAPTQAQQALAGSLMKEWHTLATAAAQISQEDLVPLNQALKRDKLPILRSDAAAPDEGESDDEE